MERSTYITRSSDSAQSEGLGRAKICLPSSSEEASRPNTQNAAEDGIHESDLSI